MKMLKIRSKQSYDIVINKYKTIIGDELSIIEFFNEFKNYFSKLPQSDYYKEVNDKYYISLDDNILNLNEYSLLNFNENFDLNEECKIGTKSLFIHLLDSLLENIEENETLQTIQILFDDMLEELEEELSENSIDIIFESLDINKKFLLKQLQLYILVDKMKINQRDINVRDLLILQKNIFKYIIIKNPLKKYIILDKFSVNLDDFMTFDNVIIISTRKSIKLEEFYILNENFDYADEESLYIKYMNYPTKPTFDEYKKELYNKVIELK